MKRSLYFKRNIINTILLVIVLFAVLALVMFAFVMKASGDDLKEAVISNYNRNINIHGNLTFGYFKDKEHYEKREVKTGGQDGVRVEILKGIQANEKVVTQGAIHVKLASQSGTIPEGHNHNH